MQADSKILSDIKKAVHEVVPGAKVLLFGSRVTGNIHAESDWDILVLTKEKPEKKLKSQLLDVLYDFLGKYGAYISSVLISEDEWENSPSYYSLYKSIQGKTLML